MSASEDFIAEIKKTETMQALLKSLEEGPTNFLRIICQEYEATNKLVPDHHLNLTGYFGEPMLRALLSAGMITKELGGVFCLYGYKPTEAGLNYYKRMFTEKEPEKES